jgi:hypothetical protein
LNACLQTALLTDSLITSIRFNQLGEHSKLYWRNQTRSFFRNAIEACYLSNDKKKAFYFMEKSKAVLLNDKLNELGALARLPYEETLKEQQFHTTIINEQAKLNTIILNTDEYNKQQIKLLQAKSDFELFLKSLEQKYPAYYSYKYDDKVPTLKMLQEFLIANKQNFVDYFMSDSIIYILGVTSNETRFLKLNSKYPIENNLSNFSRFCSNKEALNNNYHSFILTANSIYKQLFEPLQIPKGNVIVCPDNFSIPFEALCIDNSGKRFLINDYAFSYVYSARFLLKKKDNETKEGNFIGFAPITFQNYKNIPQLNGSAPALKKCAGYYSSIKLFTERDATRSNLFHSFSGFNIIAIFSPCKCRYNGR